MTDAMLSQFRGGQEALEQSRYVLFFQQIRKLGVFPLRIWIWTCLSNARAGHRRTASIYLEVENKGEVVPDSKG